MQHSAYLSIGSNIYPRENIPKALRFLSARLSILHLSSAWCTEAVGTSGPDFVNMAVHVETSCRLPNLKQDILYGIEDTLGRVRSTDKYAPRPIDLDIVIFDGKVIDPNLSQLDYLILPLSELLPDFSPTSDGQTMTDLANKIKARSTASKLEPFPDFPSTRP